MVFLYYVYTVTSKTVSNTTMFGCPAWVWFFTFLVLLLTHGDTILWILPFLRRSHVKGDSSGQWPQGLSDHQPLPLLGVGEG